MKSTGLLAIACAAAVTVACGEGGKATNEAEQHEAVGTTGQSSGSHGVDGDARYFAQQASKNGAAEVELGKLASERAQSAEVREFAQMMVRDHTKGADELKQAVATHGLALNAEPPDEQEELLAKLRDMRGADFDREYMEAMVKGHQAMKAMISGRVDQSRLVKTNSPLETAINAWAANALPTVEQHLQKAQQIHDRLRSARNTTN
jgi:putative membrane protein